MRRVLLFALLLALPGLAVAQGVRYYPSGQNLYQLGKPTSEAIRFYPSFITSDPLSTLLDGLVSYWPLDEESGTRYDSVGSNDLTDNNTVGFDTGVNGNAASFVAANTEYLSRASVSQSAEWTMAVWAKSGDANAGFVHIAGTWPNENGGLLGTLLTGAPTNFNAVLWGGTGAAFTNITSNVPNGAGNWHLLVGWFDGDKLHLQVDGGTIVDSASLGSIWTGAGTLYVGSQFPGEHQSTNGQLDEVAIWSRVLSEEERAELYAMGAGKFYPFE